MTYIYNVVSSSARYGAAGLSAELPQRAAAGHVGRGALGALPGAAGHLGGRGDRRGLHFHHRSGAATPRGMRVKAE